MFYKETNFRETEAARCPADWDIVRLGDVCGQRKGIVIPSGNGRRFVGLEHVEPGETRLTRYTLDTEVRSSKLEFHVRDILYGKLRPYLDKAVIADFDGICSTDFIVLSANEQELVTDFLLYLLHSPRLTSHAISTTTGTNHPRTSWSALGNFRFGLPPIAEQRGVAQVLSTVDEAIQKTNEVITKTERLKRGLTQELLTKGIGHKEFKTTEVGEIPKEWDVITVGDVTTEHKQGFYTNQSYSSDGVRLVRITDLFNPRISYETMPFLNLDGHTVEQFGVSKGDFLIARSGAIGRFGIATENIPCVFGSYIIRFRFDQDRLSNDFFGWLFQSNFVLPQLLRLKHGATNININAENLKSIKIPLPKPAEQALLVLVLSTLARKLELDELDKLRLERTKAGLMDLLLTGKVRVKAN